MITHEREKLADAILFFVKKTKYCGLTKLFKLLYFLDFQHFRETGKSVTGLRYVTWPKGPAPEALWFEIQDGLKKDLDTSVGFQYASAEEDGKLTKISPKRKVDGRYFSKRERRIMEELAEIYRDATADMIVEVTHLKNKPWDVTLRQKGEKQAIDYFLSLDGSDDRQIDPEEIEERVEAMREARKVFR